MDKQYKLAQQLFQPWRDKWLTAEQASQLFGRLEPRQVIQAFEAHPCAPPTACARVHTVEEVYPLPPLQGGMSRMLDHTVLAHYSYYTLAFIAWRYAQFGGNTVMLKWDDTHIASFAQLAPTLHYFIDVKTVLVPGSASLHITDGYQFWIPRGWTMDPPPNKPWDSRDFKGEVRAFKADSSFVHDMRKLLGVSRNVNMHTKKAFSVEPHCGDSADLMAIIYQRFVPAVGLNYIVDRPGNRLFDGLEAIIQAKRQSITADFVEPIKAAKFLLEQ